MAKKPSDVSLRARALRYLAQREYSRAELRAKLLHHVQEGSPGQQTEDIDGLLDDLEKRNWLSDARAIDQLVTVRRKRYGMQRIAHELREKGIAESLIDAAIPHLKETELEAAREVWQKKFGVLPQDQKEKARQVRFLQGRGFSLDVVFRVLRTKDTGD